MEYAMGFGFLVLMCLMYLLTCLRIAREYERSVVFRLGRFVGIRGPGLYLLPLFLENEQRIDLRTQTVDVERQETITKDSVTITVNAVLWFKVVDPEKAIVVVEDFQQAVYQVALTSLRNVIGQHLLDEVLKERDQINKQVRKLVDEATDAWGVKVDMIEMKDVEIPESMQRAMAREAEATREKRARIIKAEAEQESGKMLCEAAAGMEQNPSALELRRIQMIAEVGAEHNTMTIVCLPSDLMTMAQSIGKMAAEKGAQSGGTPKAEG
jgi:regulator of protease activity HflC (stomatin/prohibitin superfamily)